MTSRLSNTLAIALAARWLGWVAAASVVVSQFRAEGPPKEPWLLLFTFSETIALTVYLVSFEPAERPNTRSWIDSFFVIGVVDLAVALGVVALSGGRESPYYLFGVSSLLVPAAQLSAWMVVLLATMFVVGYGLEAAFVDGPRQPWQDGGEIGFAAFISLPFIIALLLQSLASTARSLRSEEARTRHLLDENITLQGAREELAADAERTRIAREIHDGAAQKAYMLALQLEDAEHEANSDSPLASRLSGLVVLAKDLLLEIRQYIFDLRPLLAQQEGVVTALQGQAKEFSAVSGLPVRVDVVGEETTLPVSHSAALYRIAQEALGNSYRHSGASKIAVEVTFDQGAVRLEVFDDGKGFEQPPGRGRGLSHIRERVEQLGGTVTIDSSAGEGTRLCAVLPRNGHGAHPSSDS